MSGPPFGMVPTKAVRDHQAISHAQLRVLADLATYADEDGWTKVSPHRIAEDLGLSRPTIVEHLRVLKDAGWVEAHSTGHGKRTFWRVVRSAGDRGAVGPSDTEGVGPSDRGVSADASERVGSPDTEQTNEQTSGTDHARARREPADELASEWWETSKTRGQTPSWKGAFVAARKVCQGAIDAGWTVDEIREAVRRIAPRTLNGKRLHDQCAGIRRENERDNPAATPFWQGDAP